MSHCRLLLFLAILFLCVQPSEAKKRKVDAKLMNRIYEYAEKQSALSLNDTTQYLYTKYRLNVDKRNIALLPVPTMYAVAHSGKRSYLAEKIEKFSVKDGQIERERKVYASTFPHHRRAMETVEQYLYPSIYNETILDGFILSPFNRKNKRYYKYTITSRIDGKFVITYRAVLNNTQLVNGEALVDEETGRVTDGFFRGEYDMIEFSFNVKMQQSEGHRDYPTSSLLTSKFRFLGNKVTAYGQVMETKALKDDTITQEENHRLMAKLRPEIMDDKEQMILSEFYAEKEDTLHRKHQSGLNRFVKNVLWNSIGENLLNRIKHNFGSENQGYFRLNPLLNPLYLGYSDKKGLYYKYDLRMNYQFTENSNAMLRFKGGYSTKRHQFYFKVPIVYFFDQKHNGFLTLEAGNGNWLKNGLLKDKISEILPEDFPIDQDRVKYFRDFNVKLLINRDLGQKLGVQLGIIAHRRSAVEKNAYIAAGLPTSYRSVAPMVEIELRPWGWSGPIITTDYERSIDGFLKSGIEYERWEFDAQYLQRLGTMRSLSYRAGFGFYTLKDEKPYFLDFTNFRENNIPGGWNDDWTGEFELLDRDWYNQSKHYLRMNVTYESPLLLMSWIPFVGHYIEKERLYGSALGVKGLFPYMEYGYGFTTRFFSMGAFVATKKSKFDGVGFKFGFELFRNW